MNVLRKKVVTISYGDGYIKVKNKLLVSKKDDREFTVELDPEKNPESGADYATRDVHFIGKDENARWLDRSFNAGSHNPKPINVTDQKTGDYDYTVKVKGLGEIDPRIIVSL